MNYALLLAACALTTFAAVNAVACGLVALLWHERAAVWSARGSRWLLLLRVFPAAFSTAFVALALVPSFLAHEPRYAAESVSPLLALAAGLGLAILALGAGRMLVAWRRTARLVRGWRRIGRPLAVPGWRGPAYAIDAPCPGVFVAGHRRPTLFVASAVGEACTAAELASIVAHEAAHAAARDNLKKLALRCLPDLLGPLRVARSIEDAWSAAVEEEADAAALRSGDADRLELASAIVKVARLVHGLPPSWATGSLLAQGPIERRVRRLAGGAWPPERTAARGDWIPWLAVLAFPLVVPLLPEFSGRLHALTEAVVKLLSCL